MQPAKDSSVAVVGLGKIGLPLAAQFASKGLDVVGCDVLPEVVESINAGRAHIHEEAGLEQAVAAAVAAGKLKATTDTSTAVAKADVVVVIVPLMVSLDRDIDYRSLDAATRAVGRGLRKGSLVIFETTLPVGTTRQRLGPMLEKESGLRAGADFHLAFSPERLYAGRIFEDLRKYPKIVGGIDERSTERALQFYRSVLDAEVWAVDNAETAEFTKLAETTYRDVNIALANQFALYAARRDVNVGQAFEAANSQPFSHIHRPSLGVGGHCIPVYPHFMLGDASNGEVGLVRAARAPSGLPPTRCSPLPSARTSRPRLSTSRPTRRGPSTRSWCRRCIEISATSTGARSKSCAPCWTVEAPWTRRRFAGPARPTSRSASPSLAPPHRSRPTPAAGGGARSHGCGAPTRGPRATGSPAAGRRPSNARSARRARRGRMKRRPGACRPGTCCG